MKNFPKLKHSVLCRILVYVIVIGAFLVPAGMIMCFGAIPEIVRVFVFLGCVIGLLFYIFKNFVFLMYLDCTLARLHCRQTARKQFTVPKSFSKTKLEKRISRFGSPCKPRLVSPAPQALRYRFKTSNTVYAKGIETVIAVYSAECLDKAIYTSIFHSAEANSKALEGKKKPRFLDRNQKSAPLNRVTVILIFAETVDCAFAAWLYETVKMHSKDGFDYSVLPCIFDLENHSCTFDSERIPYIGLQYPVKNRGIRTIRKLVFHGRFPYSTSPYVLEPLKDEKTMEDLTEIGLWTFWRRKKREMITNDKERRKRFSDMGHKQIYLDNGYLYLKWEDRGIWIAAEYDEEQRTVGLDAIDLWTYPKSGKIAKKTATEMKNYLETYFSGLGYAVIFYE